MHVFVNRLTLVRIRFTHQLCPQSSAKAKSCLLGSRHAFCLLHYNNINSKLGKPRLFISYGCGEGRQMKRFITQVCEPERQSKSTTELLSGTLTASSERGWLTVLRFPNINNRKRPQGPVLAIRYDGAGTVAGPQMRTFKRQSLSFEPPFSSKFVRPLQKPTPSTIAPDDRMGPQRDLVYIAAMYSFCHPH
ncbi:hypothetical protein FHG87_009516 [Trinorchestia longiramus]|nr:hypothetical protein FHG87_009516 [Trinorchestia longiramus]